MSNVVTIRSFTTQTPSYRNNNSTANATVVVSKPSGVVDGDLLVVVLGYGFNTQPGMGTVPSGWTLFTSGGNGTDQLFGYWKIASGEPSTWTWIWNVSGNPAFLSYGCVAFIGGGFNVSTPVDASAAAAATSSGQNYANTVTPAITSDMLLFFAVVEVNAGAGIGTTIGSYAVANNNPSWTQLFNVGAGNGVANTQFIVCAYGTYLPTSATGGSSIAVNASGGTVNGGGILVAIGRNNVYSGTVADTVTETDSLNKGFVKTVSEVQVSVETVSGNRAKSWQTTVKHISNWLTTKKS